MNNIIVVIKIEKLLKEFKKKIYLKLKTMKPLDLYKVA